VTLLLLVVACVLLLFFHDAEGFAALGETNQPRRPSIFVSVASYRDSECSKTIDELFRKAKFPDRIFVGVCEQNSDDPNEVCSGEHDPRWDKQIRTIRVPHTQAQGPCVARYACSTLLGSETYFLQIDSHTMMVQDWDEKCVEEIGACPVPNRSILSMYPLDVSTYDINTTDLPVMCNAKFNDKGLPIFAAAMKPASFVGSAPKENAFIAAGFLFCHSDFVRKVPYDPSLKHLFQGEEVLLSARAWTSGFDIYTPRRNICLHHYLRHDKPKSWDAKSPSYESDKAESERRARRLLGLEAPVIGDDRYGLGQVRSIDDYWKFAKLDPATRTSTGSFCQ